MAINETTEFFVEPTIKSVRGQRVTRWELSKQSGADQPPIVIDHYASKSDAINAIPAT